MTKKFPYGYNIDKYIEECCKRLKKDYFWFTKDMLDKRYKFTIEKEDNKYQYIRYYKDEYNEIRTVLDWIKSFDEFYSSYECSNEYSITKANPIKDVYKVPIKSGSDAHGWYLERYEFNSHELGGFSVFVQAGDRVTGGSRTFYIPQDFFNGTYEEYIDKHCELIPPSHFGMGKEELLNDKNLKKFLGF